MVEEDEPKQVAPVLEKVEETRREEEGSDLSGGFHLLDVIFWNQEGDFSPLTLPVRR